MNVYRITVRDEDGELSQCETEAAGLHVIQLMCTLNSHDVVKIERIDRSTGEVIGGSYNE